MSVVTLLVAHPQATGTVEPRKSHHCSSTEPDRSHLKETMKPSKTVLIVDAAINLILGFLLLIFSQELAQLLGVPATEQYFYPNILGGVLFGIGIALLIECFRRPGGLVGLGLGGAIAINLCGGLVLIAWLIFGKLSTPVHGQVFLWVLAIVLVVISGAELFIHVKTKDASGTA
jgi:hypothetical protein